LDMVERGLEKELVRRSKMLSRGPRLGGQVEKIWSADRTRRARPGDDLRRGKK